MQKGISEKLHLGISAIVVIGAGLVYGVNPEKIIPYLFNFEVENLELKNIFRAVMGLYLAFAFYWLFGIFKLSHRRNAILSNVIFMAGLAFGRIISTFFDGISVPYSTGLLLEVLVMIWGIYNLQNRPEPEKP